MPLGLGIAPADRAAGQTILQRLGDLTLLALWPDGVGHIESGSIEELIWGELGALPRSRHTRSWSGAPRKF
jgi:hypothetical protein